MGCSMPHGTVKTDVETFACGLIHILLKLNPWKHSLKQSNESVNLKAQGCQMPWVDLEDGSPGIDCRIRKKVQNNRR